MSGKQGQNLDRKKFFSDPVLVTTIAVLIAFLTLFILYPLAILLVDSFITEEGVSLGVFKRIMGMPNFRRAITNTLKVGFLVGITSALLGLLFAYVEVYVKLRTRFIAGRLAAVRSLPLHDHAFRKVRNHHQVSPAYL